MTYLLKILLVEIQPVKEELDGEIVDYPETL